MPVAINLFASQERMLRALEISSYREWEERLEFFLDPKPPEGLVGKLKALPRVTELASVFPKTVRSGALPGGRPDRRRRRPLEAAGPQVLAPGRRAVHHACRWSSRAIRRPARRNVGMYRMQVFDRNTTGMHWQKHKDGAGQARGYEREGRRMEVAVAIGVRSGDGVLGDRALAARRLGVSVRRLPPRRERFRVVRARDRRPARAGPGRDRPRGLRRAGRDAAARVRSATTRATTRSPTTSRSSTSTAVTRRRAPVYPTTIVGPPPHGGRLPRRGHRAALPPLVRKTIPEIVDMYLPVEGVFHNLVIVPINKRFPGHARKSCTRSGGWAR